MKFQSIPKQVEEFGEELKNFADRHPVMATTAAGASILATAGAGVALHQHYTTDRLYKFRNGQKVDVLQKDINRWTGPEKVAGRRILNEQPLYLIGNTEFPEEHIRLHDPVIETMLRTDLKPKDSIFSKGRKIEVHETQRSDFVYKNIMEYKKLAPRYFVHQDSYFPITKKSAHPEGQNFKSVATATTVAINHRVLLPTVFLIEEKHKTVTGFLQPKAKRITEKNREAFDRLVKRAKESNVLYFNLKKENLGMYKDEMYIISCCDFAMRGAKVPDRFTKIMDEMKKYCSGNDIDLPPMFFVQSSFGIVRRDWRTVMA